MMPPQQAVPQQGLPGGPSGSTVLPPPQPPSPPPPAVSGIGSDAVAGGTAGAMPSPRGGIVSDAVADPNAPQPSWGRPAPSSVLPPNAAPTAGPPMTPSPPIAPQQSPGYTPPLPPVQMGATPDQRGQQFMAGVGGGLANIQGTGAFASLARGAGGGIVGAQKEATQQFGQDMAKQKQAFDQSSAAFKDVLAAAQQKNMEGYRAAQEKYLTARADAVAAGGTGRNAVANTPYGQMLGIEREANRVYGEQMKNVREQFKLNNTPEDEQNAILGRIQQQRDAYANRLYQQQGIDPNARQRLKTMGQTADNPFTPRNAKELHELVPEGGWFRDPQSGKVMKFTKPQWDKYGPTHQKSENAPASYDDMAAMSG